MRRSKSNVIIRAYMVMIGRILLVLGIGYAHVYAMECDTKRNGAVDSAVMSQSALPKLSKKNATIMHLLQGQCQIPQPLCTIIMHYRLAGWQKKTPYNLYRHYQECPALTVKHAIKRVWNFSLSRSPSLFSFVYDNEPLGVITGGSVFMFLWNIKNGKPREVHYGYSDSGSPVQIAYSSHGKILITAGWDLTVRLWNIKGKNPCELDFKKEIALKDLSPFNPTMTNIAISPAGNMFAFSACSKAVHIWSIPHGALVNTLWNHSEPEYLRWSDDGNALICVLRDRTIGVWNALQGHALTRSDFVFNMSSLAVTATEPGEKLMRESVTVKDAIERVSLLRYEIASLIKEGYLQGGIIGFSPSGALKASLKKNNETMKIEGVDIHQTATGRFIAGFSMNTHCESSCPRVQFVTEDLFIVFSCCSGDVQVFSSSCD